MLVSPTDNKSLSSFLQPVHPYLVKMDCEPEVAPEKEKEEEDKKEVGLDADALLPARVGFTSEDFKIELNGLPKFFGNVGRRFILNIYLHSLVQNDMIVQFVPVLEVRAISFHVPWCRLV